MALGEIGTTDINSGIARMCFMIKWGGGTAWESRRVGVWRRIKGLSRVFRKRKDKEEGLTEETEKSSQGDRFRRKPSGARSGVGGLISVPRKLRQK